MIKKVLIENLQFNTIIGLLEHERITPQMISVSASFVASEFIDYAKACFFIESEFNNKKFEKVEDALDYFQEEFKKNFKTLEYFYMKILKLEIIKNANVGAQIEAKY